uniref:NADH-ubiquinone oxidoreductase chain 5 n=1 Tax=Thyropygus sp. DVL-2001 TaxID=174155 RepID=Q8WA83_9MYRI|nr:NADH dehydrogenase subunit 5 [Thyropygus sp. DVL-2001]AAL18224.1 NADH dehydrogenase subunit 5 [Thyropygus sp. DVL-2001]
MKGYGISKMMSSFLSFVSFFVVVWAIGCLFLDSAYLFEWVFFSINGMDMSLVFLFDWMSLLFFSVVLIISSSVLYYSHYYMEGEANMPRFIMLVLLFVLSMVLVILSPSFISILLGWDGLGLVSYCLVIYYQNYKSFSAGMLTVLSNRIGDVGLLIAIGWLMSFGGWNFYSMGSFSVINLWVVICVFVAGLTKSAQMPFSAWLPAAMAAPTPVSALVHSSTLVTAGVYLLIRFSHLMEPFGEVKHFLFFVSMLTMFLAGMGANFEMDLKKIVALSTLSQLGLMMSMVALGNEIFAFFHLLTHALFKALLFLCAGKLIHVSGNNQDIRFMGGSALSLPLSLVFMNAANFSLCGFPFMAGFYSKDLILEYMYSSNLNLFMIGLLYVSTMLTCMYSFRLSWYLSGGLYKGAAFFSTEDNESGYTNPMLVLFMGALIGGSVFSWLLFETPNVIVLGSLIKLMPVVLLAMGVIFSLNMIGEVGQKKIGNVVGHSFVSLMWFMPSLSGQYVIKSPLLLGDVIIGYNDKTWGEYFGGQGAMKYFSFMSAHVQAWQYNSVKIFIMLFLSWGLVLIYLI